ncbi:MAG TPA: carbohydrate ABC transporter permease, partial [Kiloniellaceae bacterium]|nr:carbohydrate ABC transporter permease [Kiloniellaceae bacterium]
MPARPLTWPLALLLAVIVIVTMFPIFWIVMTAIKPPTDWNAVPAIWVPADPTIINFQTLFDPEAIGDYGVGGVSESATAAVGGSLLASIAATLLSVTVGLFAAIGLSRY